MALGRAFIEVHADTAPFARELATELERIVGSAQVQTRVRESARKTGESASEGVGQGIRRNRRKVSDSLDDAFNTALGSGALGRLVKGIVDTIDDGLSGLPAEIKAVLGAALVVAAPIAFALGAGIAQAIGAGLLLFGGAGLGVLIGAQFDEVRNAAADVLTDLRTEFLQAASAFTGYFYVALDAVRDRFAELQPELVLIFAQITRTLEPIVDSIFDAFEFALPGISAAFANITDFLGPLREGLGLIGQEVGDFFELIATHEDAPRVFGDILLSVAQLLDIFTAFVETGLEWYGVLLDIGQALGFIAKETTTFQEFTGGAQRATNGAIRFNGVIQATTTELEAETKAAQEANRALNELTRNLFSAAQGQIDFERGLRSLTESVKENGRSLDITKESGAQNAEALLNLARVALTTRDTQIALTGDVDAAQAAFEAQRAKIYEVARQMRLSEADTRKLIGALLGLPPPKNTGISNQSITNLRSALSLLRAILPLLPGLSGVGGAIPQYADGGIVSRPTLGLVGEAGPEAIIPLSNPARAAEVMNEAGLSGMAGSPVVNVYIGNEQIRDYIVAETNQQLTAAARAMTYGTRGF